MHRPRQEVSFLTQHVGHHECGQLGVGVGVEQAIVWQGVKGVTWLVLHEVEQRRVGVVRRCDGGDLVVLIPSSSSSATTAASALTGVALKKQKKSNLFFRRAWRGKGKTGSFTYFGNKVAIRLSFFPPSTQSINKHKEKCKDRSCLWAILPPRSAYVPACQSSVIVSYNINKTLSVLLESIWMAKQTWVIIRGRKQLTKDAPDPE